MSGSGRFERIGVAPIFGADMVAPPNHPHFSLVAMAHRHLGFAIRIVVRLVGEQDSLGWSGGL